MSNKKSTEPKSSKKEKVVNSSNIKQSAPKKDSQKLKEILAWAKQSRSKSS